MIEGAGGREVWGAGVYGIEEIQQMLILFYYVGS